MDIHNTRRYCLGGIMNENKISDKIMQQKFNAMAAIICVSDPQNLWDDHKRTEAFEIAYKSGIYDETGLANWIIKAAGCHNKTHL